jgi:hypothetical protein
LYRSRVLNLHTTGLAAGFNLQGLTSNGIGTERMFISMKLFLLKYTREKFLKENALLNSVVLFFY